MAGLADFRSQHPEYNDMPDAALSDALYKKFYSDLPRDQFDAKMTGEPAKPPSMLQRVGAGLAAGGQTLQSAATGALESVPFVGKPVADAAAQVGQLAGNAIAGHPVSPSEALSRGAASNEEAQAEHPVAGAVGTAGGIVAGSGPLSAGLKVAESLPVIGKVAQALQLQKGDYARNAVRLAAPGAAVAGAEAAANGEGLTPQAGIETAVGAATGLAGGGLALGIGKLAQSPAVRLLASKLNVSARDIAAAMTARKAQTGRNMSIGEVMDLQSQGALKDYAAKNPPFGSEMAAEMQRRETQLPQGKLPAAQAANVPSDVNTMTSLRNEKMDTAMGKPNRVNEAGQTLISDPTALRNQQVADARTAPRILESPKIARAARDDPELLGLIDDMRQKVSTSYLSVEDFEQLRQELRRQQSALQKSSPARARQWGNVADKIEQAAARAQPQYGVALEEYRRDSNYIDGFTHAQGGGTLTEIPADSLTGRALASREGKQGFDAGSTERQASEALNTVTPNTVRPPAPTTAGNVAHGAAAIVTGGSASKLYHMLRAIPGVNIPDAAQRQAARMLYDPAQAPRALAYLRAHGAQEEDLSRIAAAVSAQAGGEGRAVYNGQQ